MLYRNYIRLKQLGSISELKFIIHALYCAPVLNGFLVATLPYPGHTQQTLKYIQVIIHKLLILTLSYFSREFGMFVQQHDHSYISIFRYLD